MSSGDPKLPVRRPGLRPSSKTSVLFAAFLIRTLFIRIRHHATHMCCDTALSRMLLTYTPSTISAHCSARRRQCKVDFVQCYSAHG
eukprot:5982218-Pleurochrysis_carterae.AAC.1